MNLTILGISYKWPLKPITTQETGQSACRTQALLGWASLLHMPTSPSQWWGWERQVLTFRGAGSRVASSVVHPRICSQWLLSSRITSSSLESPSTSEANPNGRYQSTSSDPDPVAEQEGSPIWGSCPFQLTAFSDEDIRVPIKFAMFNFLTEVYTL